MNIINLKLIPVSYEDDGSPIDINLPVYTFSFDVDKIKMVSSDKPYYNELVQLVDAKPGNIPEGPAEESVIYANPKEIEPLTVKTDLSYPCVIKRVIM